MGARCWEENAEEKECKGWEKFRGVIIVVVIKHEEKSFDSK